MLLTAWATASASASSFSIDSGWASTWVKMAASWAAAGLYAWSLLAPAVLRDRDFSGHV